VRIEEWMRNSVETVKPLDSILHAREIMTAHRINQLPVVARGKVIGIVTDRDLREAFPSVFVASQAGRGSASSLDTEKIRVEEVMTSNVMTLSPGDTVEHAARIMLRERFGAMPIVDGKRPVGILTRSDVLRAFVVLCESTSKTEPDAREKKRGRPARSAASRATRR